ncbi:heterokaryon incompatibility protein-domain-containing protein [Fusarium oxysporum]|nr:heterokaryon incompatibility protein-domain-containing protein [Fusarium oxysporum]
MTLCNLCRTIPLDTLPTVPQDIKCGYMTGYPYIQYFRDWRLEDKGFLHYQSLDALQGSASDLHCVLCNLILEQVLRCQAELEKLKPSWELYGAYKYAWPLWEFWLVKPASGRDGFWVMTFTDELGFKGEVRRGEARLVAAIGLCVKDGDPLEGIIRGRPIEKQRGTPIALGRVCNWLKDCDKHSHCSPTETFLPTRVIDVGDEFNSPYVKLRETQKYDAGRYVALSYCWGNVPQFTTTKSTLQDRKDSIMVSNLPKTHQDAIQITQRLRVRYLWIDSICICQGDKEDWERESAKMLSVYANSYLTIAASNGTDSSEGLFSEIPTRKYVQIDLVFEDLQGQVLAFSLPLREEAFSTECLMEDKHPSFPTFVDYITLPKEPLSGRGWTLQERVLSHRTLHYSNQQMLFECNEAFLGEDGLFLQARFETVHQKRNEREATAIDQESKHSIYKDALLKSWYRLVQLYGKRHLSIPSDKLPAISGLASIFAERLDDQYLAGLWRSDLVVGLCWQGLKYGRRRVREYRAPSWSWASVDGDVSLGIPYTYNILAKIMDVEVTLKGANPYGEVLEGKIKICAPMERLYLTRRGSTQQAEFELRTENAQTGRISCCFDSIEFTEDLFKEAGGIPENIRARELFALLLIETPGFSDGQLPFWGLVIERIQEKEEYQRVGNIRTSRKALREELKGKGQDQARLITLM